jgi:hypothetical protein
VGRENDQLRSHLQSWSALHLSQPVTMSSGHRRHPATVVISHGTFVDVIYPLLDVRDILSLELVCRDARISVKGRSHYIISLFRIDSMVRVIQHGVNQDITSTST